jgi:PAS domain S-box-containing protein
VSGRCRTALRQAIFSVSKIIKTLNSSFMKLKPEIKYALLILASGVVVVLFSMYIFAISQRPVRHLAEVNELEALLGSVKRSAFEMPFDKISIHEMEQHVEDLNKRLKEFSESDFLTMNETPLGKLNEGAHQISSLHTQLETALKNVPDSVQEQLKSNYSAMIEGPKEIISANINKIESSLVLYRNELQNEIQRADYYRYSVAALICVLFAAHAIVTYRKSRSFEDYKRISEEKSEKETNRMETMNRFVEAIAHGRYSETVEFEKGDQLAERMGEMKEKLMLSAEADRKRNWATQGMAEIGALLRDTPTLDKLYSNITKFCVKYTNSNQASLFVLNEEQTGESYLELVSTYAYNKRKFLQKRIELGEGLVGQVVLEAQTINMTRLPHDYISITSGLGDAPPSALIIVPLKLNEKIFGVLEMASFRPYEPYEIDFLEKLGESVASSISAARTNDTTKILLEKSQQQMEELRAQEEEVRQNMEELSATQEQMARQMEETKKLADDLQVRENVFALTTILSESDLFGNILLANDKLVEVSQYSRQELIGKPHNIFRHPDMPKELFKLFWETIKMGKVFRGVIKNRAKDGSHYWVDATIVPVLDQTGKTFKYIGARYHITDDGFAEHLYNLQAIKFKLPPLPHRQRAA